MRGGYSIRVDLPFLRDFKKLPLEIQQKVDECIKDLGRDPIPSVRRAHPVSPKGHKPTIFSLDITSNKSHKLTFHLEGDVAVLRRVGTHKQIDRTP
ncbi:MAG: hypothetical protein QE495_01260 [Acidovorax sp.]|uniref:type II toxin-antitoxin system RelE family toxin n=1 Tax=Acidovorax sp. TaxID=1872122 RepID=UPI0026237A5F|nr:hypothetical protein [Acidovorax sp.]MDH4425055.1 hypothetical protein [Acidovorax sp.]